MHEQESRAAFTSAVSDQASLQPPHKKKHTVHKVYVVIILVLLIAGAGVYGWGQWSLDRQHRDFATATHAALVAQAEDLLRVTVKPLQWAVRAEMIRGNYDQIDVYLAELVREQSIEQIFVAQTNDAIVAASDRNLVGSQLGTLFAADVLSVDQLTISEQPNGALLISAPILGISERLGVVVLVYQPAQ